MSARGACIDSYGVGDAIATSKAAPCFGNVYKLVQIDGRPVLKRSEERIKLINPGFQITYRITKKDPDLGDIYKADVTCLCEETPSPKGSRPARPSPSTTSRTATSTRYSSPVNIPGGHFSIR